MARFMFLFRSNPGAYQTMSPEQMQQTVNNWMEWKNTLAKSDHVEQIGERLDGVGKVLRGRTKSVTDGPFIEVKDFIQGYMVVRAESIEQALELAQGCPVLESDGTVEIRPIASM